MNDKTKLTDEDRALFRDAMRAVMPLHNSHKANKHRSVITPQPYRQASATELAYHFALSDHYLDTVTVEQKLSYQIPGIIPKVMQSLRQGLYPITDELDLHGLNVEMARGKLCQAVHQCYHNKRRCLLVIHGKSRRQDQIPILKNHVNHWLKQIPLVLAFCTAQSHHGGTGAIYVLLKKNIKSPSD